jgi:hypothetical protein
MATPLTSSVMLANVLAKPPPCSSTDETVLPWRVAPRSPRAIGAAMNTPDDDLTDDHMRLMEWLYAHPTGSLATAAQALGLALPDVEGICSDLVDAGRVRAS